VALPGIVETADGIFGEPVTLIQLSQPQATGIRSDPATLKIGNDFLGEKTFKAKLFMAVCFHRVSRLRSCLFGDFSILADTLSSFKNFSRIMRVRGCKDIPFQSLYLLNSPRWIVRCEDMKK
jgi:hypothetical protein